MGLYGRVNRTLSLSNASLTGFDGRVDGEAGVDGAESAIIWGSDELRSYWQG